jgi:hypothetical protein
MPLPRLVHPQTVTVEPISKTATQWDGQAREPVAPIRRRATVTVQAQVHWARRQYERPGAPGVVEVSDGFLVFRRKDVEAASWTPARGDRVATVSGAAVELYLLDTGQLRGQYLGQWWLLRVTFATRQPRHD